MRSIADALGGHCVTLRRTTVEPFSVEEADEGRYCRSRRRFLAWRRHLKIAHAPSQLERQPGGRDQPTASIAAMVWPMPSWASTGRWSRSIRTHASRWQPGRPHRDPRAPARAPRQAGVAETLVASFRPEFQRQTPEEFIATYLTSTGVEAVAVGADFHFRTSARAEPETLAAAGLDLLRVEQIEGVSSTAIRDAVRDEGVGHRRAHAGSVVRARRSRRHEVTSAAAPAYR